MEIRSVPRCDAFGAVGGNRGAAPPPVRVAAPISSAALRHRLALRHDPRAVFCRAGEFVRGAIRKRQADQASQRNGTEPRNSTAIRPAGLSPHGPRHAPGLVSRPPRRVKHVERYRLDSFRRRVGSPPFNHTAKQSRQEWGASRPSASLVNVALWCSQARGACRGQKRCVLDHLRPVARTARPLSSAPFVALCAMSPCGSARPRFNSDDQGSRYLRLLKNRQVLRFRSTQLLHTIGESRMDAKVAPGSA